MNRVLATIALALGLGAAVAGAGDSSARWEMSVTELAERIRTRRATRLIDVRDRAAYADYHLPTAQHPGERPLTEIVTASDTVVLYDGGDGLALKSWQTLRRAVAAAYWLSDGPGEWMTGIMTPLLAPDASPEDRRAFALVAELSRYFGGLPRVGTVDDERRAVPPRDRRGCAF